MAITLDRQHFVNFDHLDILARQVVEGFIIGLHKSPYHGFSVEFAEHRLYNSGESVKDIDWKVYARTDKLYVKKFEEESNLRCQIVIDASASMYFPQERGKAELNKMEFSVLAAAALSYLLKNQRDAVGLSIFDETLKIHTPARTSNMHHQIINNHLYQLVNTSGTKKTAAAASLHQVAEAVHRRSLVVIFSDMLENIAVMDEVFLALQHLKHNKHEVVLFHVSDKGKELDFTFENRPHHFIDMETGEEVKLLPGQIKDYYLSQMSALKKQLVYKCAQYKIDLVEADINQGMEQVLLPYLVKRQRMLV
jgi:uncharacterized protein (DUF58 family)